MYAIIKAGGKQQRVQAGDVIEVEYMHGIGDAVTFHPLLIVDDDGTTHFGKEAERAVVTAKPVGEQKGDKVRVVKFKNKTGYTRHAGHRQLMTLLEISDVSLTGAVHRAEEAVPEPKAEAPSDEALAEPVEEAVSEAPAVKAPASAKTPAAKTPAKKPAASKTTAAKKPPAAKSGAKKPTTRKTK
jgi:large subunit ribosomal protein L21